MSLPFFSTAKTLIKDTFVSARNHNITQQGAAIAFYTIFSTAPLIIIVLSVTNIFLTDQQTAQAFTSYLSRLMGHDIANSLLQIAQDSSQQSSGFLASIIAGGMMLFGATTVISQLKNSLNTIWEVSQSNISSILRYLFNRLLAIVIILVLAAFFLASLVLEGGMTFFAGLFSSFLPDFLGPVSKLATSLLSIFISILFFTLIFKILPDINAPWKDILVGAVVTTILFLIGKFLVGLYVANTSMYASYKTAGSFIVFLIWVYYNVQVVLIGAEFTHVYTRHFGVEPVATKDAQIFGLTKLT